MLLLPHSSFISLNLMIGSYLLYVLVHCAKTFENAPVFSFNALCDEWLLSVGFLAYTMYILSCLLYYHLADISWCGSYVVWYLDSLFWIICRPLALLVQALELAQLAEELVSCIPFAVITLHCWWCSGGMQSSLSTFLNEDAYRFLETACNCTALKSPLYVITCALEVLRWCAI